MNNEKLGYLDAQVDLLQERFDKLEERFDRLESLIEGKLATAEAIFSVIKFIGLAAVAILTFKFGDISRLWTTLFR